MDLTLLRYFQAIAHAGSLTAAARVVGVSQPTLTVAMQKLEGQLDTTLLLRDRRGITLTETGRELLQYTAEIFELVERAELRVRGLESDEDVGRFTLALPDVLGAYFLPDFLYRYVRDTPRVTLELISAPSRGVLHAVIQRDAHFGIAVNPLPHPDLVLVELFDDATDLFVTTPSLPTSLEEAHQRLARDPLLFVEHLPQSQDLLGRLEDHLPPRRIACGTLELVKSLALADVGVAMLPRRVASYHQEGRLSRLHPELPFIPDTIYLAYRADMHRTRAAMRLKDALVDHGRGMASSD